MRVAPLGLRDGGQENLAAFLWLATALAGPVLRARIGLFAAQGVFNTEIAPRRGVSRPTVIA